APLSAALRFLGPRWALIVARPLLMFLFSASSMSLESLNLSALTSYSAIWASCRAGTSIASPRMFLANTVLPAPMKVILATVGSLLVKRGGHCNDASPTDGERSSHARG